MLASETPDTCALAMAPPPARFDEHAHAMSLALLARGKRPKEISEDLVVSVATVRSHVQAIYSKTKVHSYESLVHLVNHVRATR